MRTYQIERGGRLIETEAARKGSVPRRRDVTKKAPAYMFAPCTLAEGVTLLDVFRLIRRNIDIFSVWLSGNYVRELLEEAFKKPKPYVGRYSAEGSEYLDLRKDIEIGLFSGSGKRGVPSIQTSVSFGSTGWKLRATQRDSEGNAIWRKGTRIAWCIAFTPVNELANIPIRLKPEVTITKWDHRGDPSVEVERYSDATFTLGEILHGIVWELSFHGGPKQRDRVAARLKATVEKLDKGTIKTVPLVNAVRGRCPARRSKHRRRAAAPAR